MHKDQSMGQNDDTAGPFLLFKKDLESFEEKPRISPNPRIGNVCPDD